jgi:hypothetical protein
LQVFHIAIFVVTVIVHKLKLVLLWGRTAAAAEIKLFIFGFAFRGCGVDLRGVNARRGSGGAETDWASAAGAETSEAQVMRGLFVVGRVCGVFEDELAVV